GIRYFHVTGVQTCALPIFRSIFNSGMDESPLTIDMFATSTVRNPYLLNVYTQEKLELTTEMLSGDTIRVTTGRRKEISRIRNGRSEERRVGKESRPRWPQT